MKTGKRILVSLLFAASLTIPTSALASDYQSNSGGWLSFFSDIVSYIFGEKNEHYASGDSNYYKNNKGEYFYIDGKKVYKKDWDDYIKKKHPPNDRESKDIWKDWYCFDDFWNKYWHDKEREHYGDKDWDKYKDKDWASHSYSKDYWDNNWWKIW